MPGAVPPFSFELIAGGRSNLTYAVTDAAGRHVVLRRPPLGHVLATAHDMAREHRIISALVGTAVPVPTTLALCTDTEVNGAPFYVMGFVDGVVLDSRGEGRGPAPAARRDVGFDLVDVLAELHLVDVDAVGLGDLAKRTGYVERQLKRWSAQWRDSKTPRAAGHRGGRGRAAGPDPRPAGGHHRPRRLPLRQLPRRPRRGPAGRGARLGAVHARGPAGRRRLPPASTGPIPATTPAAPTTRPAPAASPRTTSCSPATRPAPASTSRGIDYYVAFSSWRLAVISEGVYARYLHGAMADDGADIDTFRIGTEELAERALAAVRRLGP